MNQIPEDIFPSAQLLHSSSFAVSFPMTHLAMIHLLMIAELAATFSVAAYCSAPRSQSLHLHAVITYEPSSTLSTQLTFVPILHGPFTTKVNDSVQTTHC